MSDIRRSKYNEHFDQMDGSYVCRICGDVFPDSSRSNRSSKMKAHLTQSHSELVLKWWPRTPEETRTFLLPDFEALSTLIQNMETVENELDAKEKISEVFRLGRQLDRLLKRYEDRILTSFIEFPETSQLKAEKNEELLDTTSVEAVEIEESSHFKEVLPKSAGKYNVYYRTALNCAQTLIKRFKEPELFASQEIAHKTFIKTKKDVMDYTGQVEKSIWPSLAMDSGRWSEFTTEEVVEILSSMVEFNFDKTWESLLHALKTAKYEEKDATTARSKKDEESGVATARTISEELLLTALGGSEESDVATAQIIPSQEKINV